MFCTNCGYQDNGEAKYCASCGRQVVSPSNITRTDIRHVPTQSLPTEVADSTLHRNAEKLMHEYTRYRTRKIWAISLPFITLVGTVTVWGLLSFLNELTDSVQPVVDVFSLFIPIIIALCLVSMPVGIVAAIYFHRKQNGVNLVDYDKRSGAGAASVFPAEARGWNWGAMVFGAIWGVYHGVWISLLAMIPIFGFFFMFVLGAKGSKWAWQKNRWRDLEEFKRSRRRWNITGIIVMLVVIPLAIIGTLIDIAEQTSGTVSDVGIGTHTSESYNSTQIDWSKYGTPIDTIERQDTKSEFRGSQLSLENQRICQEAALQVHKLDASDMEPGTTQMRARFKYIPEESLCVYKGGFINTNLVQEYLKDAMTNEILSEYIIRSDGVELYGDKNEFEKIERQYF